MPLEIRELVIKAVVEEGKSPQDDPQSGHVMTEEDLEALVQACVEQVLQIIKDKEER